VFPHQWPVRIKVTPGDPESGSIAYGLIHNIKLRPVLAQNYWRNISDLHNFGFDPYRRSQTLLNPLKLNDQKWLHFSFIASWKMLENTFCAFENCDVFMRFSTPPES
jgi:hypothetical protein